MASNPPNKSNVLVFGATGVIGRYIVHELVAAKSSFGRLAAFTSPESLEKKADAIAKLRSEGVEIITGDLTKEEDVLRAYEGESFRLGAARCGGDYPSLEACILGHQRLFSLTSSLVLDDTKNSCCCRIYRANQLIHDVGLDLWGRVGSLCETQLQLAIAHC
jgi:NAD(P)-dependent dehydrogenase (short-subunit alcohol dehydrogenase family)